MKKKVSPKELFIYKSGECKHEKRADGSSE